MTPPITDEEGLPKQQHHPGSHCDTMYVEKPWEGWPLVRRDGLNLMNGVRNKPGQHKDEEQRRHECPYPAIGDTREREYGTLNGPSLGSLGSHLLFIYLAPIRAQRGRRLTIQPTDGGPSVTPELPSPVSKRGRKPARDLESGL